MAGTTAVAGGDGGGDGGGEGGGLTRLLGGLYTDGVLNDSFIAPVKWVVVAAEIEEVVEGEEMSMRGFLLLELGLVCGPLDDCELFLETAGVWTGNIDGAVVEKVGLAGVDTFCLAGVETLGLAGVETLGVAGAVLLAMPITESRSSSSPREDAANAAILCSSSVLRRSARVNGTYSSVLA